MKLKQSPGDFQVEELTPVSAGEQGEFAFYRLDKSGWTTPDALGVIRRRWQIDFRRLSYGGLKDRHASTSQYLSIYRGPKRNLNHERIVCTYLGQCGNAYSAQDISANRFTTVLRSMNDEEIERAVAALAVVTEIGVPNYFDDQRFGSVNQSSEFVAKEMVFGRFERALWLALAAPYEFDRKDAKIEKSTLRDHWGDWSICKSKLPRGHSRSIVDYLCTHATDFKGAIARLRPELQGLYLSAYQSYLWNRLLGEWLTQEIGLENIGTIDSKLGVLTIPIRMPEEKRTNWETLVLPLPSARLKPEAGAFWLPIVEKVLQSEGLALGELKIKGMQKPFFSKGDRAACLRPANLSYDVATDDLNSGKRKMILKFDLPRGCYATMVIKRITSPLTYPSRDP
jgi:tRNA pseudouridine13 synthase